LKELELSTIFTKKINGYKWSVISVISPYSSDFHVMVMETDNNRYLPSLEYVEDNEGNQLMDLFLQIISYMEQKKNQKIFFGYNWSPRSWGDLEEEGGFQSIPTKWHGMFYTQSNEFNEYINEEDIDFYFKKLNNNNYYKDISKSWQYEINKIIQNTESAIITRSQSSIKDGGLIIEFDVSLKDLLKIDEFFSKFLKPIASYLNTYFFKLNDSFFDNSLSKKLDEILNKTSYGMISSKDYKTLQEIPTLLSDEEIVSNLKKFNLKEPAINELIEIVKNRYNSNKSNSWRKGFAYSLYFEDLNNKTILKIVPGAYLRGGVVEISGLLLKRSEDTLPSNNILKEKSNELFEFGNSLK
ncbi:hypothetical protein LJC03_05815, partial [Methanobrevibacter sp. OttesenSCG-928-I08]|nr:hypothetical protein [Methanobrevibacter sp. OttesenSCG-928-I08]